MQNTFSLKDVIDFPTDYLYFSNQTNHFYCVMYWGMGLTVAYELCTYTNSLLNQIIDKSVFVENEPSIVACTGRLPCATEADEKETIGFESYYIEMIKVVFDEQIQFSDTFCFQPSLRLSNALNLAAELHGNQVREADGLPFINHLLEVKHLLISAHVKDEDILVAAVLKNSVEHSRVTKMELVSRFGNRVANLVQCLVDEKYLLDGKKEDVVIEHTTSLPYSIKLIKFADICSNVSHLPPKWTTPILKEKVNFYDSQVDLLKYVSEPLLIYYQGIRASIFE